LDVLLKGTASADWGLYGETIGDVGGIGVTRELKLRNLLKQPIPLHLAALVAAADDAA
jgi:hypothetical protein